MVKCKFLGKKWGVILSSSYNLNPSSYNLNQPLIPDKIYYMDVVNSCNYPYAVFDENRNCIDCFKIKDFNKLFDISISEIRKEKLKKLNEKR